MYKCLYNLRQHNDFSSRQLKVQSVYYVEQNFTWI